jgi:phosphonate degradation associated HDIG domain protein
MESTRKHRSAVESVITLLEVGHASRYERRHDDADAAEAVTQMEHALQCAALAEADAAPDHLVAAALLHDIGHVLMAADRQSGQASVGDLRHESVAARYIEKRFDPAVATAVGLHVLAKRYLCAVDPAYLSVLSPVSVRTLAVQGGALDAAAVAEFEARPGAMEAVALRRWDDCAKTPGVPTRRLDDYRPLLASLATA